MYVCLRTLLFLLLVDELFKTWNHVDSNTHFCLFIQGHNEGWGKVGTISQASNHYGGA